MQCGCEAAFVVVLSLVSLVIVTVGLVYPHVFTLDLQRGFMLAPFQVHYGVRSHWRFGVFTSCVDVDGEDKCWDKSAAHAFGAKDWIFQVFYTFSVIFHVFAFIALVYAVCFEGELSTTRMPFKIASGLHVSSGLLLFVTAFYVAGAFSVPSTTEDWDFVPGHSYLVLWVCGVVTWLVASAQMRVIRTPTTVAVRSFE